MANLDLVHLGESGFSPLITVSHTSENVEHVDCGAEQNFCCMSHTISVTELTTTGGTVTQKLAAINLFGFLYERLTRFDWRSS